MEATAKKATFQKYPAYKESGVEWLGELPKNWDEVPLCTLTKLKSVINCSELELLSVYLDLGVIKFSEVEAKRTNVTSQDLSKYQRVDIGDFVLNNQQAWRGSVGVSNHQGIVSPAYLVLELSKKLHTGYANYMFRSGYMVGQYLINSKGVGTIQRNLYWPSLRRAKVILPPLPEQTAIAAFLDDKTAKIDRAIAQKEKMITLLKERKQIIIQNAVTKGLNPNAKMKHSGVEWIGEIPEHYSITKLGLCLKPVSIKNRPELPLLSITRELGVIVRDTEDQEANHNFIPDDLSGYKVIKAGQFGMNKMKAWQGSYGVSKFDGIVSPAYYVFDIISDINPDFFHLAIRSKIYVPFFAAASDGVRIGQWDLNKSRMKEISLVIPPIDEQLKAIEFIENQSEKIDRAIAKQELQIEKLKELKSTLIDSAVTGKLRVPSVQEIKVS